MSFAPASSPRTLFTLGRRAPQHGRDRGLRQRDAPLLVGLVEEQAGGLCGQVRAEQADQPALAVGRRAATLVSHRRASCPCPASRRSKSPGGQVEAVDRFERAGRVGRHHSQQHGNVAVDIARAQHGQNRSSAT